MKTVNLERQLNGALHKLTYCHSWQAMDSAEREVSRLERILKVRRIFPRFLQIILWGKSVEVWI
jgi:hypothetical protein